MYLHSLNHNNDFKYSAYLTITRGDEVSDAAGLKECTKLAARVEHVHELDHLHETEPNDGRLRIVPETQTVHKAGAHRHYVLNIWTMIILRRTYYMTCLRV